MTPLSMQPAIYSQALLGVFAVGAMVFGLALDAHSLWLSTTRARQPGHTIGLPFVPWLLYFVSMFFFALRGMWKFGVCALCVLTILHVVVHVGIYRGTWRPR